MDASPMLTKKYTSFYNNSIPFIENTIVILLFLKLRFLHPIPNV